MWQSGIVALWQYGTSLMSQSHMSQSIANLYADFNILRALKIWWFQKKFVSLQSEFGNKLLKQKNTNSNETTKQAICTEERNARKGDSVRRG
jgi:hypothetical protein